MQDRFKFFWQLSYGISKTQLSTDSPSFHYAALVSERLRAKLDSLDRKPHPFLAHLLSLGPYIDAYVDFLPDALDVEISSPFRAGNFAQSLKKGDFDIPRTIAFSLHITPTGSYVGVVIDDLKVLSFYPEPAPNNFFFTVEGRSTFADLLNFHSKDCEKRKRALSFLLDVFDRYLSVLQTPMNSYALALSTRNEVVALNSSVVFLREDGIEMAFSTDNFPEHISSFISSFGKEFFVRNLSWVVLDSYLNGLSWFGVDELVSLEGVLCRVGRVKDEATALTDLVEKTLKYVILPIRPDGGLLRAFFEELEARSTQLKERVESPEEASRLDTIESFIQSDAFNVLNSSVDSSS